MRKYSTENNTVVVNDDNCVFWYKFNTNILHREDGPAIETPYGSKFWYQNGKLHRVDGPAAEYSDGSKEWYLNGKRHRINEPAVELVNGTKEWYQNGLRHREDGPAIEQFDGSKLWWLEGIQYSETEFKAKVPLFDQLKKLIILANESGLYDAADYLVKVIY